MGGVDDPFHPSSNCCYGLNTDNYYQNFYYNDGYYGTGEEYDSGTHCSDFGDAYHHCDVCAVVESSNCWYAGAATV